MPLDRRCRGTRTSLMVAVRVRPRSAGQSPGKETPGGGSSTEKPPCAPGTPPAWRPFGRSRRSSWRRRRPVGSSTGRPGTAGAGRSPSRPGIPRRTPSCSWLRVCLAARAWAVTIAVWWAIGMAGIVGLACCLLEPIRRTKAALARRRQVQRRAEALLLGWLSPDQRRQYQANGWFEVMTTRGYRYRVLRGGVVRLDPSDRRTTSKRPPRCRPPMRCWQQAVAGERRTPFPGHRSPLPVQQTGLTQRLITDRARLVGSNAGAAQKPPVRLLDGRSTLFSVTVPAAVRAGRDLSLALNDVSG
jgi:hypothetical protein